jgi:hypothetical protein
MTMPKPLIPIFPVVCIPFLLSSKVFNGLKLQKHLSWVLLLNDNNDDKYFLKIIRIEMIGRRPNHQAYMFAKKKSDLYSQKHAFQRVHCLKNHPFTDARACTMITS